MVEFTGPINFNLTLRHLFINLRYVSVQFEVSINSNFVSVCSLLISSHALTYNSSHALTYRYRRIGRHEMKIQSAGLSIDVEQVNFKTSNFLSSLNP